MLVQDQAWFEEMSDEDRLFYHRLLPQEHPLLDALKYIPWESFVPELESHYCPDRGQPAIPPLRMLKLEFLRYFYRLSDREVIARAQTDVLFRWFLQIPVQRRLPDPSLLTRFRGRLGAKGFQNIFDRLVGYAREANLVRDRLRLKDASHVIANIAVPTTLTLLAQLRERMLATIHEIDAEVAEGFQIQAELIRVETQGAEDDVRLQSRLDQVLDILHWIEQQTETANASQDSLWQKLQSVGKLAQKITDDVLHPGQGHRTLSVVDSDARRGKHGDFYNGYLIDVMLDADSQIITEVEVIAADSDETKDAVVLVTREQQTHGNQIDQFSIDGIGFNGEMLRALENPAGPNVTVITPVRDFVSDDRFPASQFPLSCDGLSVTCPAGQQSSYRNTGKTNSITFQFKRSQCENCPLLSQCNPTMTATSNKGRSVTKNKYETEYERVRKRSQTRLYQEVRREHPMIERKLNEILRHQGGRRARYWGLAKVRMQEIMTCMAVNVKRISRLLKVRVCAELT